MADLVEAADDAAAQVAKTGDQTPAVPRPIDETPTEPATTPRQIDPEVREWPVELQLPTLEYGPRPEPEVYPCRHVMNDGQWTPEEHEAHLYKAGQAHNVHAWHREARAESERQNREFVQSMADWKARTDVHEALRQHDPSKVQLHSQSFQRKPLQQQEEAGQQDSTQKMSLQGLESTSPTTSTSEASRIYSNHSSTSTRSSSTYRSPSQTNPQPPNPATLKHPLPQPAQQGPPNMQVGAQQAPSPVDLSNVGTPSPEGPPASFLPTPVNVHQMDSSAAAALPGEKSKIYVVRSPTSAAAALPGEKSKIYVVRSPSDIDWRIPLKQQLEPNLKRGPDKTKTFEELCMLRKNIPKMNDDTFQQIYPCDNILCAKQKTGARHTSSIRVRAWVLNGTHWFRIHKQPMMIVIWCRDGEEASKFQYLMQILQVNLGDYIPRYQIFVQQEEDVNKLVQHWMEPTTLWEGNPVIGFVADSYLDDLQTVGFKHFNPMWNFPATVDYSDRAKDALVSQSPIVCLQVMQYASSIGHCQ